MYHVGETLNLRTKVLRGRASQSHDALTISGPSAIQLPIRQLRAAELFRLHGLGRCVRISHEQGTVYVSVVRFVLFGYFAVGNFLRTGELARRLREAIGGPSYMPPNKPLERSGIDASPSADSAGAGRSTPSR